MIELATASVTIAAPINIVFKYLSNMENYGQWFPGVISMNSGNNLAHGVVGKTYLETISMPNGNSELEIIVDKCEANQLFQTKGNLPEVLPQMTLKFSATEEENCHVELHYHSRNFELTSKSQLIIALRNNLSTRASKGVVTLKNILEQS